MGERCWQATTSLLWAKPDPLPLCQPQITHGLIRDRVLAHLARGWGSTTWATARSVIHPNDAHNPTYEILCRKETQIKISPEFFFLKPESSEKKAAEEYCWVITQAAGRSSHSGVLEFGFQLESHLCTCIFDRMYIQCQLAPICTLASLSGTYDRITKVGECLYISTFCSYFTQNMGRDISVGKATCYGLDGPEIESRWGRDFPHPPRPAWEPTQPPIQWIPGHSRG